jgi:hypoxanthine phosphoribosyltransferase
MNIIDPLIPLVLVSPGIIASLRARMVNDAIKQKYSNLILLRGKEISNENTNIGLKKLINYANKFEPDFIIGINRGGMLIGAYISLALGIPSKNFKRCCVVPMLNGSGEYEIDCSINDNLIGKVLVVDSIIRTGGSMKSAFKELQQKFPDIETIKTATVITVTDKDDKPVFEDLDYCVFGTQNPLLKLPWSEFTPDEGDDYLELRKTQSSQKKQEFHNMENKPVGALANEVYISITTPSASLV